MRIQPHIWCAPPQKESTKILKDVIRNTITTHGHSRAIIGAAFHALILREALLKGEIPSPSNWNSLVEMLEGIPNIIRSDEELMFYWLPQWESKSRQKIDEAIHQSVEELKSDIRIANEGLETTEVYEKAGNFYTQLVKKLGCFQKNLIGSATKTALLAAYLSYIFRDRPHDGLIEAVNLLGSDTDTIATMAGAIMGSIAKTDTPELVVDSNYLIKEAERLSELSEGQETASHPYPDMLYWQPPTTQLDALGQYEGKWLIKGLGEVKPIGKSINAEGKNSSIWQWFCLDFGQTVLVKRRHEPNKFDKDSIPFKSLGQRNLIKSKKTSALSVKRKTETRSAEQQTGLWDKESLPVISEKGEITVDEATNISIRSGFNVEIVGSMPMKLAQQERGIEKSVAFAAIIAKAKQARIGREKQSGP